MAGKIILTACLFLATLSNPFAGSASDHSAPAGKRSVSIRGLELENQNTSSDLRMQVWVKSGANLTITVMIKDGSTNAIVILPK